MYRQFILIAFSLMILVISNEQIHSTENKIIFIKGKGEVHRPQWVRDTESTPRSKLNLQSSRSYAKLLMRKRMKVQQRDKLITKKGTSAIIKLESGNIIKLKENTTTFLSTLKTRKVKLNIHNGVIIVNVKKSHRQRFQLEGLTTLVSVKGTTVYMRVSAKMKKVWVLVIKGKVKVIEKKSESSRIVKSGMGIMIKAYKPVGKPVPFNKKMKLENKNDQSESANTPFGSGFYYNSESGKLEYRKQ